MSSTDNAVEKPVEKVELAAAEMPVEKPAAAAVELAAAEKPAEGASAEVPDDGFALRGLPFILVMFAMCLAVFIGGLDGTIVVVAMPQIAKEFDALSLISWIFLAFLLTQTAGTPLWGQVPRARSRRHTHRSVTF